jgi:hypothetical protein
MRQFFLGVLVRGVSGPARRTIDCDDAVATDVFIRGVSFATARLMRSVGPAAASETSGPRGSTRITRTPGRWAAAAASWHSGRCAI